MMEYTINIDLYDDWIKFLKNILIQMNCTPRRAYTADDISFGYFNLQKRLIKKCKRKIMKSKEFSCPPDFKQGLKKLENRIKNGEDLRPYLSKRITDIMKHDPLLNDWGIHHLHLGTIPESTGFMDRTGPVLFARFTNETAFLIAVMEHGKNASKEPWTDQRLLKIIYDNWPDSIDEYRLQDTKNISYTSSDDEIKKFREAGIQTFITIDDNIYMPFGGGYAINSMSVDVRIQADNHRHTIKNLETWIKENYLYLLQQKKNVRFQSTLEFHLLINGSKVEISEKYSQQIWTTELKFKNGILTK